MHKIREILVPTDLSENSKAAFGYARDLAEWNGARIVLVHVSEDPRFYWIGAALLDPRMDELARNIETRTRSLLESSRKQLGRRCDKAIVLSGSPSPAREIAALAARRKSGLIVVATHGRSGWSRFSLGSTAERLVREATCPVLTVRAQPPKRTRSAKKAARVGGRRG